MAGGLTRFPLRRRRQTVAGLIVAGALIAAILTGAFGLRLYRSLGHLREAVDQASAVMTATGQLVDIVRDAETSERAYLLTMRPNYLEPFWDSSGLYTRVAARLQDLTRASPELSKEVAALRASVEQRMRELNQTIQLAMRDGEQAALPVLMQDLGSEAMDGIRQHAARIDAISLGERFARTADLVSEERRILYAVLAAAMIGIVLLSNFAFLLLLSRDRVVHAQHALKLQSERLEGAIERLPEGIAVFDSAERLLLCNATFCPAVGIPADLGKVGTPLAQIGDAAADCTPPLLASVRLSSEPAIVEVRCGRRTLEAWRSPLPDGGQILGVADVTLRVQAEAIARQAQRIESLGQLTGGVAHDFNNLLQVVSANLELVDTRPDLGARVRQRIAAAQAAVERGAKLTQHLLAFARKQPLAPEAIDTGRLLRGMHDLLARTLGSNVMIEVSASDDLWPVRADPTQLENAVINMCINARDAIREKQGGTGGWIRIQASNAVLGSDFAARHADAMPGHYALIAISDTGIGMKPEQAARAIDPFYTTKPAGKGTGLGLSMVYGFVKQSGGYFQIDSVSGEGTTIRIYLPRSHVGPSKAADDRARPPRAEGEVVLVVEDDAAVRGATMETLAELGYKPLGAETAAYGLGLIEAGHRPDVLLADIVLPGELSARDLAARAVGLLPDLALVFTSGYTADAIVHHGELDPDVHFLPKPWRLEELAQHLRAALDRHGSGARGSGSRRILLVEDDELVRATTADLLAALGHQVVQAGTASEALAALSESADILLTDLGLPNIDGRTLAARAREIQAGIPVIIASGRSEVPHNGFAQVLPGRQPVWLIKPYDEKSLTEALDRVMTAQP